MEPVTYDSFRELRESVERNVKRDRWGLRAFRTFLWFWCSWMSFGVWAFFFGEVVSKGEDLPPWPLEMYLGIPVAATFGALVTFAMTRRM